MKKSIFVLLFALPFSAFSQVSEDFRDGEFRNVPGKERSTEWTGDVEKFVVNSDLRLQLNAPTTGSPAQLRTHSELSANTYWEFWVKMDFNPTAQNYTKVFLCSDESNLTEELNGLFVRIGYTNKNVCLVLSQKGKTNKILIEGESARLNKSSVSIRLKATLNRNGLFSLYSKLDDEPDYVLEGTCTVSNSFSSQYFGIACYFSSTRNKAFSFDDFLVRELREDEQGDNGHEEGTLQEGDVVFSEVMANPGDGNPEYVELYNASDKTFNLKNYRYYYGDNAYTLPDGIVDPHTYFVLSKTTATLPEDVKHFGVTSFPTLANTGKLLMFADNGGSLISWFEYSDALYGSSEKKSGGWSLECIDTENKSNTASNWTASDESGGTPGRENSVKRLNPDTEIPEITGIQLLDNNGLHLAFSKPMNRQTLQDKSSYITGNSLYEIEDLQTNYPQGTELDLQFAGLPPQGELTELTLEGVRDLSGFELKNKQVMIGSGHEASAHEIVINEILFHPKTGGNEYVEIYNHSDKAFDLRFLSIATRKLSDNSLNKSYPLADIPLLLQPQEYLVITKGRDLVCAFFECHASSFFVELNIMPALANTSGCVVLLNNHTDEVIDEFAYSEGMHAEGISNKQGISLERVDFGLPSDDPENWHSASAQSGYGTPGYRNSQVKAGIDEAITVSYPAMDVDNYAIHYRLNAQGYRCNAGIYDSMGRTVKVIANNELLGSEGSLEWNGKGSSGQKLPAGIYIIYMEVYDMKGVVKKTKKPVVVR